MCGGDPPPPTAKDKEQVSIEIIIWRKHRTAYSDFRLTNTDHPLHFSSRSSNTTRSLKRIARNTLMAPLLTEVVLTASAVSSSSSPLSAFLPPQPTVTSRVTQASCSSDGTRMETAAATPRDSRTTQTCIGQLTPQLAWKKPSKTKTSTKQSIFSSLEPASRSAHPPTSLRPFSASRQLQWKIRHQDSRRKRTYRRIRSGGQVVNTAFRRSINLT